MELFFSIIAISGILGGLIFALDSSHTHSLSIPWDGKDVNTGWFGHVIVGIGGSIVAVGAAVPIFKLNLIPFTDKTVGVIVPLDLILYLLAFGVLGGYSGLRIISGMSDAMMKKLEQEIEAKVNKTTQEFRDKLAKNMKDERSLKQDIEKYKDDHDLMKGAFLAQTGKSDDAIEVLLQQTQKHPDNHKGWMWLGHAYKNKQQYDKALECSTTAEKLAPEVWGYSYNCACYSSLSEKDEGTITSYLEESVRKFRKDERFPSLDIITELFKTDKDLAFIRDEKQVNVMDLLK